MPMVDAERMIQAISEHMRTHFDERLRRLEDHIGRQGAEIVKLKEVVRELKTGLVEIEAVRINGKWLKVSDV